MRSAGLPEWPAAPQPIFERAPKTTAEFREAAVLAMKNLRETGGQILAEVANRVVLPAFLPSFEIDGRSIEIDHEVRGPLFAPCVIGSLNLVLGSGFPAGNRRPEPLPKNRDDQRSVLYGQNTIDQALRTGEMEAGIGASPSIPVLQRNPTVSRHPPVQIFEDGSNPFAFLVHIAGADNHNLNVIEIRHRGRSLQ